MATIYQSNEMNLNDLHHRTLHGRPIKRSYSLNFSMFDYVLERKLKLGTFDQVSLWRADVRRLVAELSVHRLPSKKEG